MNLIAGKSVEGTSGERFAVTNPANGAVVQEFELAGAADVQIAVAAAKEAFPGWSGATPGERSTALTRLAEVLNSRAEEFARTEVAQTGKPIRPGRSCRRSRPATRSCSSPPRSLR